MAIYRENAKNQGAEENALEWPDDGDDADGTGQREAFRPLVTYLLLIINAVVFAAMWRVGNGNVSQAALAFGVKDNDLIRAGQWWRLITPIFLHGNLEHIAVNSLSLYWLGSELEGLYGRRRYLLVYLISGIAGNYVSFLLKPAPSLGASGAIFGLVGAAICFPIRFRSLLPEKLRTYILTRMGLVAAINLGIGFAMPNVVDNWAHLGGLVGGVFAALLLRPEALERGPKFVWREWAVTLGVVFMCALVGEAGWRQYRSVIPIQSLQLVRYPSRRPDSWVSLGIPRDWKRIGPETLLSGDWAAPDGSVLRVLDSGDDAQEVETVLQRVVQAGSHAAPLMLDGKPARHLIVQNAQSVEELFVVEPYPGRFFAILLACRPKNYAAQRGDFFRVAASVRFVHPPTDERENKEGINGEGKGMKGNNAVLSPQPSALPLSPFSPFRPAYGLTPMASKERP